MILKRGRELKFSRKSIITFGLFLVFEKKYYVFLLDEFPILLLTLPLMGDNSDLIEV